MSNVKASVQFSKSTASFTPSPLPIRDGNSPTIDMNFNGLNTVCKSNSERISALSDSIFKVNSVVGSLPLSADPSASIGLAAVNGSAVTYMRSDAAPALSQAIVPTWTGVHTFAAQPKINTLTASKPVFTDASKGLVSVNTIGVPFGGTGAASFTANSILYGNGTGAIQELTVQATSTIFFLTQASSGIPDWRTLTASDMAPVALAGDVTWAYTSALTTTIGANKVTYAKFQQVAASSLVGNASGSLANAAGITLGSTLTFSGSALQTLAMTGDVSSSANSFVTTIGANKVTLAMMAQVSTGVLLGRYTDGTGNVETLDASSSKLLLGLDLVQNTALSTWAGSTNITTLGTVATGTWSGTVIAIAKGGTGQTTASTGFNALSPLTALGDILYGGASGAGTRLAGNTSNVIQVLCQTGTGSVSAAPAWNAATGTGSVVFSASPTLTGTISAASMTLSSTLAVTGTSTLTGNIGVGGSSVASNAFRVQTTNLTGTDQYGVVSLLAFNSSATSSGNSVYAQLRTAASSFTMTNGFAMFIDSPVIGSGSAVTNMYGLNIQDITGGGTKNYAIKTGAGTLWFGSNTSIGSTPAANNAFIIYGSPSGMSGVDQVGINSQPTMTSASTTSITGIFAKLVTASAAFTSTNGYGIRIETPGLGSGSVVTTVYGLKIEDQTQGGTNYAIYTGAGLVRFGGSVRFDSALTPAGTSGGYDEGSFTGTLVGCTTSPTDTFKYVRVGKLVTIISSTGLTGTSNSTQCSLNGLPASLTPPGSTAIVPLSGIKDSGNTYNGAVGISAGGVVTFFISTGTTLSSTGFTASGTKGLTGGSGFTYSLNT